MTGMESHAGLIRDLRSGDKDAAELASRRLRRMAETAALSLEASRKQLLQLAMDTQDLRVRWNLMIVVGKLALSKREQAGAVDWLLERLGDESPFTRTFALQALFDQSRDDEQLRARVLPIAHEFAENGTAAMRARARKLLKLSQKKV